MSTSMAASDEFLGHEAERTFEDYSFAWEGELETITDYEDTRLITLPTPWFGLEGIVERIRFDPATVEQRLDTLLAEVGDRSFWWIIGPSSQPADLTERLEARGVKVAVNWDCLGLDDLSVDFSPNPDVLVEPLTLANAEEYADFCVAEIADPEKRAREKAAKLVAAHRYIAAPTKESQILLGRLDGVAAGCVVLHVESNGIAYLRNAGTLKQFRGRGIYLTLIHHRLQIAKAAGCTAAVVQAQTHSSSPILRKRGFRRVGWLKAATRPGTIVTA